MIIGMIWSAVPEFLTEITLPGTMVGNSGPAYIGLIRWQGFHSFGVDLVQYKFHADFGHLSKIDCFLHSFFFETPNQQITLKICKVDP